MAFNLDHSTSITQVDSWWKAEKLIYKVVTKIHLWLAKLVFERPLKGQFIASDDY